MGFYIQHTPDGAELPRKGKADVLLQCEGVYQIHPPPTKWVEDLVCVVENPEFDAAGYIYSQRELEDFAYSSPRDPDRRRKSWLHVPGAAKLNPYGEMARDEAAGR
jgi:hypothetical protein